MARYLGCPSVAGEPSGWRLSSALGRAFEYRGPSSQGASQHRLTSTGRPRTRALGGGKTSRRLRTPLLHRLPLLGSRGYSAGGRKAGARDMPSLEMPVDSDAAGSALAVG